MLPQKVQHIYHVPKEPEPFYRFSECHPAITCTQRTGFGISKIVLYLVAGKTVDFPALSTLVPETKKNRNKQINFVIARTTIGFPRPSTLGKYFTRQRMFLSDFLFQLPTCHLKINLIFQLATRRRPCVEERRVGAEWCLNTTQSSTL